MVVVFFVKSPTLLQKVYWQYAYALLPQRAQLQVLLGCLATQSWSRHCTCGHHQGGTASLWHWMPWWSWAWAPLFPLPDANLLGPPSCTCVTGWTNAWGGEGSSTQAFHIGFCDLKLHIAVMATHQRSSNCCDFLMCFLLVIKCVTRECVSKVTGSASPNGLGHLWHFCVRFQWEAFEL